MKIAVIVDEFPSVSETFVLNQITGFIKEGHEVNILANKPQDGITTHADVNDFDLLAHTRYWRPGPQNIIWRYLVAAGLFVKYCYKFPLVMIRALNIFKYGKPAASMRLLFDATSVLDESAKYDIILCHFGPNGIRGMLLRDIGAISGRLLTVFHGYDITRYLLLVGENVYEKLFETGDLFLPVGDYWRDRLLELGCKREKIFVHRMGVDTKRFHPFPRSGAAENIVRVLSVARFVEKKGLEYGIRAVAKALNKHTNIEYTIIGDGPLRAHLEALIKELGMERAIRIVGWVEQSKILAAYEAAYFFLAPSVTSEGGDQEGIPVVLMEAMAMGLPVISTWHTGIPELVEDGISGFLVPERDVSALFDKLIYLIDHPEEALKMGAAGRKRIEEYYDIEMLNERLLEKFKQLCGEEQHVV